MPELYDAVWPVALVLVGVVGTVGFKWLKDYVADTPTKKDDELLEKIVSAFKDVTEKKEEEK